MRRSIHKKRRREREQAAKEQAAAALKELWASANGSGWYWPSSAETVQKDPDHA